MQPQYAYQTAPMNMPMMAEGGLAAAAKAQSQGRGGDTMLVHMSPGEVKGLQALAMAHGGSLTINPSTGLPEAGFLQRLLPMILGAGLTIASGGALTPLMAAGIVGTGYGVAKGSLKEGLMAGLGAYGGAGLGAGLGAAGATAAGTTAGTTAGTEAAARMLGVPGAAAGTGSQAAMLAAENAAMGLTPAQSLANIGSSAGAAAGAAVPSAALEASKLALGGPEALLTEQGRSAFMEGMKATPYSGMAATMSGLGAITPEPKGYKPTDTYQRSYEYAWNPNQAAYDENYADSSERRYFNPMYTALPIKKMANGGVLGLAQGGDSYSDEPGSDDPYAFAPGGKVKSRSLKGDPFYKFAQDRRDSSMEASIEQNFAKGGLGAAGKSLPPRFLSGDGDGMSDSIKANIDGQQEARLADGEFVVPADVVSHLGNGSSKAGAKKLYAMMDKIRKARTGRERQAPEVNAHKYMPA